MKKVISILCVVVLASATIFAGSFNGKTEVALNYSYRNGTNMGGLSVNNSGYSSTCPIGYTINVNADFDPSTWDCSAITMLIGPSYKYSAKNNGFTFELAVGVSATGENISGDTCFLLGAGGFTAIEYNFSNGIGFALGAQVGYDMLCVPFNGDEAYYKGVFYVTPSVGMNVNY